MTVDEIDACSEMIHKDWNRESFIRREKFTRNFSSWWEFCGFFHFIACCDACLRKSIIFVCFQKLKEFYYCLKNFENFYIFTFLCTNIFFRYDAMNNWVKDMKQCFDVFTFSLKSTTLKAHCIVLSTDRWLAKVPIQYHINLFYVNKKHFNNTAHSRAFDRNSAS